MVKRYFSSKSLIYDIKHSDVIGYAKLKISAIKYLNRKLKALKKADRKNNKKLSEIISEEITDIEHVLGAKEMEFINIHPYN